MLEITVSYCGVDTNQRTEQTERLDGKIDRKTLLRLLALQGRRIMPVLQPPVLVFGSIYVKR